MMSPGCGQASKISVIKQPNIQQQNNYLFRPDHHVVDPCEYREEPLCRVILLMGTVRMSLFNLEPLAAAILFSVAPNDSGL